MTPTDPRCPDCGSLVRAGMGWCTLCHADLRTEQEKEAARVESSLALVASGAGLPAPPVGENASSAQSATDASTLSVAATPGVDSSAMAGPGRGRHARATATSGDQMPADGPGPGELELAGVELSAEDRAAATAAESEAKLAELRASGIDVDGMLAMLAADRGNDALTGFVKDRLDSKGSRAIAILVASAALTSLGILVMFALGSIVH